MINKRSIFVAVCVFCNSLICAQNETTDSLLTAFSNLEIQKIENYIELIDDPDIKRISNLNFQYLTKGLKDTIDIDYRDSSIDIRSDIVYDILLNDYYTNLKLKEKNSVIFENLGRNLESAKIISDSLLQKEIIRRLCEHIIYKTRDADLLRKYIKDYSKYFEKAKGDFWINYLKVGYYFMQSENNIEDAEVRKKMERAFQNLFALPHTDGFRTGRIYQLYGVYLSHWEKNYGLANEYYLKADSIFGNVPYWYAKSRRAAIKYNTAINYYKNEEPEKAIPFLRQDLNRDKEKIYLMYTNEWLYKCYERLKRYDSAFYYFKEMNKVKEEIDQNKYAIAIRTLNRKYDIKKKEVELKELASSNKSLKKGLYSMLPLLIMIIVISLVLYYLYSKNKSKTQLLTKEKSETLKKLDELKSIVIKNHIILKDKTKIYISDFIYVKSNDHYLDIFMSKGRKHFIRGTLSQLKDELPPNFIQCHRSYIVNSNYIKRSNKNTLFLINGEAIPVSRTFKDNLN